MGYTKDQLLDRLKELEIDFDSYSHPAVLTVEAQAKHVGQLGGLSKNLLLKDKKHRFYVVSALAGTNVDLKVLSMRLGLGKGGLRMAPEEALQAVLQVPLGCVTPFALINDSARTVSLLLDQGFKAQECCLFHPLSNDMTIAISSEDLDKFLSSIGRKPSYIDLEATPPVGKDNPPDLASLVPSDVPILPDRVEEAGPPVPSQNNVTMENKVSTSAEAKTQSKLSKVAMEKPQSSLDPLAESVNVKKFVGELINKTAAAILSEISKDANDQQKELLEPLVLDGVRKRITLDLENQTVMLKNAAYTLGFNAGLHGTLPRK